MKKSTRPQVGFLSLVEGNVVEVTIKRGSQSSLTSLAAQFVERGKHKPKRYLIERVVKGPPRDFVPPYGDTNTERDLEIQFLPLDDNNKIEANPITFKSAGFNDYDNYAIPFLLVGKMRKEWIWEPDPT